MISDYDILTGSFYLFVWGCFLVGCDRRRTDDIVKANAIEYALARLLCAMAKLYGRTLDEVIWTEHVGVRKDRLNWVTPNEGRIARKVSREEAQIEIWTNSIEARWARLR